MDNAATMRVAQPAGGDSKPSLQITHPQTPSASKVEKDGNRNHITPNSGNLSPHVVSNAASSMVVKSESTVPPSLPPSYQPIPTLIENLYSPDLTTQTKAYEALMEVGDLSVVQQLIEALSGTESQLIEGARGVSREQRIIWALSMMARKDPNIRQWLLDIMPAHPSPDVRAGAIRVFREIKYSEAIPSLIVSLQQDPSEKVRRSAAVALSEFPSSPEARKASFEALIKEKYPSVIGVIGQNLPDYIGPHLSTDERSDLTGAMLKAIGHHEPKVRQAAIDVLAELGSTNGPAIQGNSQILPALKQALNDQDSDVQAAALAGVGQMIGGLSRYDGSLPRRNTRDYAKALSHGDMSSEHLINLLVRAEKLQIHHPYRLGAEDLETIIQMRETHSSDKRSLAVVIHPTQDLSGAFNNTAPVSALLENGYRVMYYEVSTDTEMVQALKDATRNGKDPAQLLVINGHADNKSLAFGAKDPAKNEMENEAHYLDLTDESRLKQAGVPSMLARGCSIVISGCSAGMGRGQVNNLPNMLRRVVPHAARKGIWAPVDPTTHEYFMFDKHGRFDGVRYRTRGVLIDKKRRITPDDVALDAYRAYSGGRMIDPAGAQAPSHYIVTMGVDRFSQKDQAGLDAVSQGKDSGFIASLRTTLHQNLDPTMRAKAVAALRQAGSPQAFDLLVGALNDGHPLVRQEAAAALSVIPFERQETVQRPEQVFEQEHSHEKHL